MFVIETKIALVNKEAEETAKEIMEGSDEHLDLLLNVIKPINNISSALKEVNKFLLENISISTKEELAEALPEMKNYNTTILLLIGAIQTSILYRDVRFALKELKRQYESYREILYDVQHFYLDNNVELDNILLEINNA